MQYLYYIHLRAQWPLSVSEVSTLLVLLCGDGMLLLQARLPVFAVLAVLGRVVSVR